MNLGSTGMPRASFQPLPRTLHAPLKRMKAGERKRMTSNVIVLPLDVIEGPEMLQVTLLSTLL